MYAELHQRGDARQRVFARQVSLLWPLFLFTIGDIVPWPARLSKRGLSGIGAVSSAFSAAGSSICLSQAWSQACCLGSVCTRWSSAALSSLPSWACDGGSANGQGAGTGRARWSTI